MATRFNRTTNPSATTNVTGWLGSGTRTRITGLVGTPKNTGAQVPMGAAAFANSIGCTPAPTTIAGEIWTAITWARSTVARTIRTSMITWNGTTYVNTVGAVDVALAANVWTQFRVTGALPAGTFTGVNVHLDTPTAGTAGTLALSSCRIEQISDPEMVYRDGSSTNWIWDGTAGSSASRSNFVVNLSAVDITTQPVVVDLARSSSLTPVDITTEQPLVSVEYGVSNVIVNLSAVDITTEQPLVDLARSSSLAPVDITTQPVVVDPARSYSLAPVDITTVLTEIAVLSTNLAPVPITVEAIAVDIISSVDVPPVNISYVPTLIDPASSINLPTINVSTDATVPTVYRFDSKAVAISIQPTLIRPGKIVDILPIDIIIEQPRAKFGLVRPVQAVNINTVSTSITAYTGKFDPVVIEVLALPVDVGFSSDKSGLIRKVAPARAARGTRVIVQHILTKKFLHWNLEVSDLEIQYNLSGPKIISGNFANEILDYRDLGFNAGEVFLHIEEDGSIRASGILQPTTLDDRDKLSFTAVGLSGYPSGIPYLGEYSQIQVDPATAIRHIWEHLQTYNDSKFGLVVVGSTPVRIGTAATSDDEAKPYKLEWWEAQDCGQEINQLVQETPMDYVERTQWNSNKTDILHFIDLGYPRIGTTRNDIRFAEGENIIGSLGPEETDLDFATQVIFMGKGEGRSIIRGSASRPITGRVRKVKIISDPMVDNTTRANALALAELNKSQAFLDIKEVEIDSRHENAKLGSFGVGDDIPIKAIVPHYGRIHQYERVISYVYYPETESIRVTMRRSDSFSYKGV